jgi:hypothetical protein
MIPRLGFIVAAFASLVGSATGALDTYINFQPGTATVPAGYIKDAGLGFNATRGFGWVREDSLANATATPLDVSKNARNRARAGIDPRLNTLIHMQLPSTSTGVYTPAAWEYTVPNGIYTVTVSVGDAPPYDSLHTTSVEGQLLIDRFQGTATKEFLQVTAEVTVEDGKLTVEDQLHRRPRSQTHCHRNCARRWPGQRVP